MAKRRRAKTRTITVRRQATFKRRRSRSSSTSKQTGGMILGAMAYGGIRAKLNAMLRPVTDRIPLGAITDEVVLLSGALLLRKRIRNPMARNVLNAGIIIESARIGEAIVDGSAMAFFGQKTAITASGF